MPTPLSILDLVPRSSGVSSTAALQNSLELARLGDRLGYHRLWYAEHHNMPAVLSTSPELLIGAAARETTRIRVGSGGVMLPNHAPLRVAESFRLLAAMHPGRIDLGLGRAPGTDGRTALALRRSGTLAADDFPEQLAELRALCDATPRAVQAGPDDVPLPPLWILGSSGYGAQLAARLGLGFAFAHHINPVGAIQALRHYRDEFQPTADNPRPHAILTVSVLCADSEAHAEHLASTLDLIWVRLHTGARLGLLPSPAEAQAYPYTPEERRIARAFRETAIIGTPGTIRPRIHDLLADTGADELMITTMVHDHADRLRSYTLLADL